MEPIRLTQFSHGAGCGCKLSPAVLHEILSGVDRSETFQNLLIGNDTKDDAAVMDLCDGTGIISTTDFFMPIVDDPRTFGRIAAANAISDIYAMGGRPHNVLASVTLPNNLESNHGDLLYELLEGTYEALAADGASLVWAGIRHRGRISFTA